MAGAVRCCPQVDFVLAPHMATVPTICSQTVSITRDKLLLTVPVVILAYAFDLFPAQLYLIGQPFLRSSELLFAFLTSPMEFTNNILPDLNLGRLVKSFPLLLAKEQGETRASYQIGEILFKDKFIDEDSEVQGCQHQHAVRDNRKLEALIVQSGITLRDLGWDRLLAVSALEQRLHSRHYWNNAGISLHQRKVQTAAVSSLLIRARLFVSLLDYIGLTRRSLFVL
ncbi:unnamed protein product [Dibothriocephalus latus]|uniref:Uncharacterized protein n=1 Tax=Dibothriocephalus latus TaxID=60516 RepID=A0A3P7LCX1_DIBLA|nr:unnamed protein product [Dibothriocephalus latus]